MYDVRSDGQVDLWPSAPGGPVTMVIPEKHGQVVIVMGGNS